MELSSDDVKRLVDAGYRPEDFIVNPRGRAPPQEFDGWCYFYSPADKRCRVYQIRPMGCRLYPVVYVEGEGVMLDELCPMRHTVSKEEFRRKAKALKKLLKKINGERVPR
jgi:Fe-S-cluster containining protein